MTRILPNGARVVPKEATKVFSGKIFDVYQWQQQMFDGSHETFEMLKRPDSVRVIAVNDAGEIVACNEEQPGGIVRKKSLPAGRMDPTDKTTLDAAKRELLEETGYTFAKWVLFDVVQPQPKIEWFVYTFVAHGEVDKVAQKLDNGEKIEVTSMSFEALKQSEKKYTTKLDVFETLDKLLSYKGIAE